MTKPRIGIYSGSFDPVHARHIAFALAAAEQANLDKVFLLIEPEPPRKQGVRALEHRQAMVEIAINDEPMLASIWVDQNYFTIKETLPVLTSRFKGSELFLLCGDDVLGGMKTWPAIGALLSQMQLVIGIRGNEASAKQDINELEKVVGSKIQVIFIKTTEKLVSSTAVKQRLRAGEHVTELLPEVVDYIHEHKLYLAQDK